MAKIAAHLRLTSAEIDTLLSEESRCRIATLGAQGDINLTPMTFGWARGCIYIFARGQKIADLRRSPAATVLVDVGTTWPTLKGIMLKGQAKILEDAQAEADDPGLYEAQLNLGKKHGLGTPADPEPYRASASGRSRRWIVFSPAAEVSWNNERL